MLFLGFFWAFYHSSLAPSVELGVVWPPYGIEAVSYLSIPLLGSILLLASGFFITLSHHSFLEGTHKNKVLSTG